jgi:hypothetical protein
MSGHSVSGADGSVGLDDHPRPGRWLALSVLVLAVLLVGVDVTVLGLATPFISEDLRPSALPVRSGGGSGPPYSTPGNRGRRAAACAFGYSARSREPDLLAPPAPTAVANATVADLRDALGAPAR